MDYELVRTLLHQTLRQMLEQAKSTPSGTSQVAANMQVVSLANSVESLAKKEGHIGKDAHLGNQDKYFVVQAIWELIVQGVLIPINVISLQEWPFISFTDHGGKIILGESPTPYDPTAYLLQFSAGMDDIMKFYIGEALGCFRANRYTASTVMLGVASERLFDLLVDSFAVALTSAKEREEFLKKTNGKLLTIRYQELRKRIDPKKSQLPTSLQENLDTCLVSIFNLIRHHRNDAGHPTGRAMTRDEAYANLYVFPHYYEQMHQLISHLRTNAFTS